MLYGGGGGGTAVAEIGGLTEVESSIIVGRGNSSADVVVVVVHVAVVEDERVLDVEGTEGGGAIGVVEGERVLDVEGVEGGGASSVVVQSGSVDAKDVCRAGAEGDVVDGPAGLTMLYVSWTGEAVETMSLVTVTATVFADSVISIVLVFAGCVTESKMVDRMISVVGACVLAAAVTVLVVSSACIAVVSMGAAPDDEDAAEPELPSTATTEYEARLATGKGDCECNGRALESME